MNRAAALANRQVQIDVATFIQWVDARAQGRSALARFYRARFRKEFEPAFSAWLATKPLTNNAAPKTPFLSYGDRVRIEMREPNGRSVFGAIEQDVIRRDVSP